MLALIVAIVIAVFFSMTAIVIAELATIALHASVIALVEALLAEIG